jgi:hypothetical protein
LKEETYMENLGVEGYIKLDLIVIGWDGVEWIHLAQDTEK